MITKLRLEIEYNTIQGAKISDFMSKMDLGINEICPEPLILEMSTTSKVDKKYKERLEKEMKEEFKDQYIIKRIKIEKIKLL